MRDTVERLRKHWWFRVSLCIVCYVILPICLAVIAIPILFLRLFSIRTAGLFRHQLARSLSPLSGAFALDDIYTDGNVKHAVVGVLYMDKPVFKDTVLKRLDDIIKGGKFPELEQRLDRWLNTYFWGVCPVFNLETHVTEMPEVISLRDVHLATNMLCRKGFPKDQPLWELTLFPNFVDEEGGSAMALRVHHCLADGFGYVSLINAIGGLDPTPQPLPLSRTKWILDWVRHLGVLFGSYLNSYELALAFLIDFNYNFWMKPSHLRSKDVTFHESHELPLTILKKAAKSMGQPVIVVLMAAFSTALREDMEIAGEPVPPTMSVLHPLPKPVHSGTLTNHFYMSTLVLPIGVRDRKEQLSQLAADYNFKRYTAPFWDLYFTFFVTFIQMRKRTCPPEIGPYTSLEVSDFALATKPLILFGAEIKRFTGTISIPISLYLPLVAQFIGYRHHMLIYIKCRADVMNTDERPKRIVSTMLREINHMAKVG